MAASIEVLHPNHGVLRSPKTTVSNGLKTFVVKSKPLDVPPSEKNKLQHHIPQ
jgi:hypothetical protein